MATPFSPHRHKAAWLAVVSLVIVVGLNSSVGAIETGQIGSYPSDTNLGIGDGTGMWFPGGGPLPDYEVENLTRLAREEGIKLVKTILWWESGKTALDMFYNETYRKEVEDEVAFNVDGVKPAHHGPGDQEAWMGFNADDLWAVILDDEGPSCYQGLDYYSNLSDEFTRYSAEFLAETGYELKPLEQGNATERAVFSEWVIEKTVWAYNHLYDYFKSRWPRLRVLQYTMMEPIWGTPEFAPPYELEADGYVMDVYYARENPLLLYESIRRFKATFPDKDFYLILWGTIWDFVNEAGDGLYYKEGSFEQMRREAWLSYMAGADIIGWFSWGPVGNNSFDWRFGVDRPDLQGQRVYLYTERLNQELSKLPVMRARPQVLVVSRGFQTNQPILNVVDAGLFSEFDAVTERAFAHTDLDLSQYKVIVVMGSPYHEVTVRKLNEYATGGGNLLYLGGLGSRENTYYNGTRQNLFPIEANTSESYWQTHIRINITRPNLLDLELDYDGAYHAMSALHIENLSADFHPIGDFYLVVDNSTTPLPDFPLLLYRNTSKPNSGWTLYWGAQASSQIPGTNSTNYDFGSQSDLWFLHRKVFRAYARFLNLTGAASLPGHEKVVVTQTQVDSGPILAGITNLYPEGRTLNYSVDLARFGLAPGPYWVHSLDANASLGQFESDGQVLKFPVEVVANGTRLLLISLMKPQPDFSIEIFPPIPSKLPPQLHIESVVMREGTEGVDFASLQQGHEYSLEVGVANTGPQGANFTLTVSELLGTALASQEAWLAAGQTDAFRLPLPLLDPGSHIIVVTLTNLTPLPRTPPARFTQAILVTPSPGPPVATILAIGAAIAIAVLTAAVLYLVRGRRRRGPEGPE